MKPRGKPASRRTEILRPAPWPNFRRQLRRPEIVSNYFRRRLGQLFPGAKKLVAFKTSFRSALSSSSFLGDFRLQYRRSGRLVSRHLRGNRVEPNTVKIYRRVHRRQAKNFAAPAPIAWFHPPGYLFYDEVLGQTLRHTPIRSSAWPSLLRSIATALSEFHAIPAAGLRRLLWPDEQRRLRTQGRIVARHAPHIGRRVSRLVYWLLRRETLAWRRGLGLTHKDFQASNIVVHHGKIGLIDYSLSGVGPVTHDIGTFLGHLYAMTFGRLRPHQFEARRLIFWRAYRRARKVWPSAQQLDARVFEVRTLVDIVSITAAVLGVRTHRLRGYVESLVARAERLKKSIEP